MSIQGIGQYGGLYQSYKAPSIPNIYFDDVPKQQNTNLDSPNISSEQTDQSANLSQQTNRVSSQNSSLQDISLVFNKNDNFDYIGKDSEIGNLDVQKAVSDMKKDQMLQEYQYFVGDLFSQEGTQPSDGMVFMK